MKNGKGSNIRTSRSSNSSREKGNRQVSRKLSGKGKVKEKGSGSGSGKATEKTKVISLHFEIFELTLT